MTFFRRREPLHVRLAREGGLSLAGEEAAGEPPPWDSAGIHGRPQPRRWDVVTTVDAPGLAGDRATFVALSADELLVEEGPSEVELLAEAVERELRPPYRAEAVRRHAAVWAVGARAIELVTLEGVAGEEIELTVRDGFRTLLVDGEPSLGSLPQLERPEHVARATRIDREVWEVRFDPL